jgi:hypothetical protein
MPNNVRITISDIGAAENGVRPATYAAGTGVPAWASVASDGDVDLNKNGQGQPDVDLEWTLPSGYLFDSTAPFRVSPDTGMFSVSSGAGTATLTVNDGNNDATQTEYTYTLKLSDGSTLDPKVINH